MAKVSIVLSGILSLSLLAACPVSAQSDSPDPFETQLITLAGTLGKIHAIQVLCKGRSDQYWRDQMSELLKLEAPKDGPLRRKLIGEFNTAYTDQEAQSKQCDVAARQTFQVLIEDGRILAETVNGLISNKD